MYNFISKILDVILVKMSKSLYAIGKENIPKDSRCAIARTYGNYNEVITLRTALLPNQIRYTAKKESPKNQQAGRFLKSLNIFPVDRGNPGPSTLKKPVSLPREHRTADIFPADYRTPVEGVPLECGAATIATPGGVPILPAAYVGSKKIYGSVTGQALIKIGKSIEIDDIPRDLKQNKKADFLTKEIERRTTQLQKGLNGISYSLKKQSDIDTITAEERRIIK